MSMRRVGEELGVEAMSLYNHVASKAALLDGILETVLAELPTPKRAAAWRFALTERACALRAVLRAHPNALPLFATRPAVTPSSIAHVEQALELLTASGFAPHDAISALHVLVAYVVGHTLATHAPTNPDDSRPDYHRLPPQAFPHVQRAAALLPTHDTEAEFALGLQAMLTGLEAHLTKTTRPPKPRARR
jgi:AcrR family transcriptional regulator